MDFDTVIRAEKLLVFYYDESSVKDSLEEIWRDVFRLKGDNEFIQKNK